MKIITKFAINDRVFILPLKIEGKIRAIYLGDTGLTYSTRYFDGVKPLDCYFTEDEISNEIPEKLVGFKK